MRWKDTWLVVFLLDLLSCSREHWDSWLHVFARWLLCFCSNEQICVPRVLCVTQKRNFNTQPAAVFLFVPLVDGMLTLLSSTSAVFPNVINVYQEPAHTQIYCFAFYIMRYMHGAILATCNTILWISFKCPVPSLLFFSLQRYHHSISFPCSTVLQCWKVVYTIFLNIVVWFICYWSSGKTKSEIIFINWNKWKKVLEIQNKKQI